MTFLMESIMKLFSTLASSFVVFSIFAANISVAETVKMQVEGMVCAFCAGSIEKKMKANAATAEVFVSLKNKIVAVTEKPGQKLDETKLKAQIADAGYEVKAIERVGTSITDIKAQMKAKKS
jgi:periplasmic mercuric ion binding protein